MNNGKKVIHFLLFRFALVGVSFCLVNGLFAQNVQAIVGTLNITGGATYTSIVTTTLITNSLTLGGVAVNVNGSKLNFLSNVTSDIQGQINLKAPLASPTFTGVVTAPTFSGNLLGNATSADAADAVAWSGITNKPFNWNGQGGQPTWLWGSNDGSNYYVWNPSNFNVNSATSATNATNLVGGTISATTANFTGAVTGISKAMVGLGNVDNTSDVNKPVSTATQTALNLKANIASPTFTGTVTAPTFSGNLSGGTVSGSTGTFSGNVLQSSSSNWIGSLGKMYIGSGWGGGGLGPNSAFYGGSELNLSGSAGNKINFLDGYNKTISVDSANVTLTNVEYGAVNTVTTMTIDTGASSRFRVTNESGTELLSVMGATGSIYTENWTAITPATGWSNFGGGYNSLQYKRVGDMIYVRGMVNSGANQWQTYPNIFTFTSQSLCPTARQLFPRATAAGYYRVDLTAWNGTSCAMTVVSGGTNTGWVSLDGLVYSRD